MLHANKELEQVFNAVSDLIYIVDTTNTIVLANRALADRCGLSSVDLEGRKCFDVMHCAASLPGFCPHARLIKSRKPQTVEFNSDKLRGCFEVTMSPLLDAEGQVTSSVHIARDVTGKRKTEKALQESEQRFLIFMENLPLAVSIKDRYGRFLFANEYLKDITNVENLSGLTVKDLFPAEVALKMTEDDIEALTQGLGLYRDEFCDKDGNELIFDTYKFPIQQSKGPELLGTISMDVTEKIHHEVLLEEQRNQLEQFNQNLETRIAEAVAGLRIKDELLTHQSRLTAMSEMISNIAHQWRQPINTIGLIAQSMQIAFTSKDLTVEEIDEDIRNIMKELYRISDTINDFRNFFSYEEERSPFLINEIVLRAISIVGPVLKSKGIRIELNEQPNIAATGYPNEFMQAFMNIVLNARDALLEHKTERPFVEIGIFKENGRSIVTVRDNGGGIPEEILPKIFDPYFTTKNKNSGAGIGLYMSKIIVEKRMNGHLSVLNVDSGTEFKIELLS